VTVQVDTKSTGLAQGELTIRSSSENGTIRIPIQADVEDLQNAKTDLTLAPNPATAADDEMATTVVSPMSLTQAQTPTGTVTFEVNGAFTTEKLINGQAEDDLGQLAVGEYTIVAF